MAFSRSSSTLETGGNAPERAGPAGLDPLSGSWGWAGGGAEVRVEEAGAEPARKQGISIRRSNP
jgi:hypothetical protein